MKNEQKRMLQLQYIDISCNHDFIGQFLSPIGQMMTEVIPMLVKRKLINDKFAMDQSLTATCEELVDALPVWMKR
jgi:hypothetical protein